MEYLIIISLISILIFSYVALSAYIKGEIKKSKRQIITSKDIEYWKSKYEKVNSAEALREYKDRYFI